MCVVWQANVCNCPQNRAEFSLRVDYCFLQSSVLKVDMVSLMFFVESMNPHYSHMACRSTTTKRGLWHEIVAMLESSRYVYNPTCWLEMLTCRKVLFGAGNSTEPCSHKPYVPKCSYVLITDFSQSWMFRLIVKRRCR